jgi:lipopolysaccharide export system permease protein
MNNIVNKYLIVKFSKIIFNTVLVFLSLGVTLNLFEEIEFFKNLNLSFTLPIVLSLSYVPTLILELFPFIIFLSSMFYFLHLKSSKDLLLIKVSGYSNIKIITILSLFSFLLGLFVLLAVNPITSTLIKYYETEKAQYARDVDHLISINRNGVWIKEIDDFGYKIINAEKLDNDILEKVSIYIFDNNHQLKKRIESESAVITNNPWQMKKVYVYDSSKNSGTFLENYDLKSDKILDKIVSLYRNLNTISFLDLVINYSELNEKGYSKKILNEKINKFATLPIFLFLMVFLASIFTIGSLKKKQNFYYVIISIFTCVAIYYFKDLSIALGQTGKISLTLSVWMPVIVISLFCSIGVMQINEK